MYKKIMHNLYFTPCSNNVLINHCPMQLPARAEPMCLKLPISKVSVQWMGHLRQKYNKFCKIHKLMICNNKLIILKFSRH